MSDPAIDAAQRAWNREGLGAAPSFSEIARAAAREALAPLRELHTHIDVWEYDDTNGVWVTDDDGEMILVARYCRECSDPEVIDAIEDFTWDGDGYFREWPCDTARLIYSSEELGDE